MAFTFFSCGFLVVCISVITHRPLYGWKAYIWQGAVQCTKGIICDTTITTARCLTPCLQWTRAVFVNPRLLSFPKKDA
jgi:hypothetical protein